jgi:hypothetical protein
MEKINMRQNIITAIVQKNHFEFIMNEAFKTFILKLLHCFRY